MFEKSMFLALKKDQILNLMAMGCPEAKHVVDYFHVIQLFTEALDRCRQSFGKVNKKHGLVRYVCR